MKVLIVVSCVLALAATGFASHAFSGHYSGPQHIPVIGPHGVPLDTPEVAAARAHHLQALAAAKATGGYGGHGDYTYASYGAGHDGLYAAGGEHQVYSGKYGYAYPVIGPHGVPLDTPEVAHARAAHLGHVAAAKAIAGHSDYLGHSGHGIYKRSLYSTYEVPAIGHNGVPLDTAEVSAAKAHHFQAVAEAKARLGHGGHQQIYAAHAVAPVEHSHGYAPVYNGEYGYHYPVIGAHGVPVETPEVAHARAAHLAALAAAKSHGSVPVVYASGHGASYGGSYGGGYAHQAPVVLGHGGVHDTPEVAHAKALHFAAHAEANTRIHHY